MCWIYPRLATGSFVKMCNSLPLDGVPATVSMPQFHRMSSQINTGTEERASVCHLGPLCLADGRTTTESCNGAARSKQTNKAHCASTQLTLRLETEPMQKHWFDKSHVTSVRETGAPAMSEIKFARMNIETVGGGARFNAEREPHTN